MYVDKDSSKRHLTISQQEYYYESHGIITTLSWVSEKQKTMQTVELIQTNKTDWQTVSRMLGYQSGDAPMRRRTTYASNPIQLKHDNYWLKYLR